MSSDFRTILCIGVLLMPTSALPVAAQQAAPPPVEAHPTSTAEIRFTYDNPGLDPAHYSIVVDETGHGHYESLPMTRPPDPTSAEMPSQALDRQLVISPETVEQLFTTARSHNLFSMSCEDGKGKIAFQGKKKLSYQGKDGVGECTFNWSKDEGIDHLARTFEAISATVEAGARLVKEHRHDPLGLDHDLDALVADFKAGRAAEVGNIAPELEAIAGDDSLMDRARLKAAKLLRDAQVSN